MNVFIILSILIIVIGVLIMTVSSSVLFKFNWNEKTVSIPSAIICLSLQEYNSTPEKSLAKALQKYPSVQHVLPLKLLLMLDHHYC